MLEQGGVLFKDAHDNVTQMMFNMITEESKRRGMVVNDHKTKLLCVSAAQLFDAGATIYAADGTKYSQKIT